MNRQRWTLMEIVLVRRYAMLLSVHPNKLTIYAAVKQLTAHPLMRRRSWESIRCRLNRMRKEMA